MTDFLQDYPNGIILALDEMSLYFQATLTRVWSPRGQTPVIAIHPQREHIHFYGALNLLDGREIALPSLKQNSATTSDFIRILLMLYPQPILLLLDRAPWHFGDDMRHLLEETERLYLLFFPPACPELNPQEHVWAQARDAVSHNHVYRRFEPLLHDFEQYLNETLFHTDFFNDYSPLGLGLF